MKHLLIFVSIYMLTISGMSQVDTLSVTISPFTKKQDQSETLFIRVHIKSNVPDSIEIDDTRSWINCINAFGVKLVSQNLQGDCYKEVAKSDCHPIYNSNGDYFNIKKYFLRGFAEYLYDVEVMDVLRTADTNLKRVLKNHNPYRFKLELPYKVGKTTGIATSKYWVYYAYPR